ncbi:hypothetical protein ACM61V_18230 [Sphingomonas sp. TX0543]|nr:hypothetical protein [Sphingomonas fennica]
MDSGTELAIRAVVRGLFHSDAINANQVRAVMSALKDAAGAAMDRREPATAKELVALCKGVHLDTAVSAAEAG